MKLKDGSLEFTENFFATFYNDWEQLFGKWNWYNLTLVEISLEKDIILPGYEFVFILLGIGVRFRYNQDWTTTPEGRDVLKSVEEFEAKMATYNPQAQQEGESDREYTKRMENT